MTPDAPPLLNLRRGSAPLLVSMPHVGTFIPTELAPRMMEAALRLPDTDWHLERLYDFLGALGASVIAATHSRYVIDLNRPPDNASLYPGQETTGLCPLDTFHRQPVYRIGADPDADEVRRRTERYWLPYHAALQGEIARLRERHATVVVWDAHSICSVVPRLFAGRLPDLNLGSAAGAACDPPLARTLLQIGQRHPTYSSVLDGRFKGGYITREYGRPASGVHAIQLELAQRAYMHEEHPYSFDEVRAAALRPVLEEMTRTALAWCEVPPANPPRLDEPHRVDDRDMSTAITRERPDSPDARALIAELEAYLEPLYPIESRHGYSVEKLIAQGVAFFLVRDAGAAAGCGGIQLFGTEYGELKRMYVRPQFRGRGLGRMILDHLARYARSHGVEVLRLETGIHQHAAIALYEQAGFHCIPPFGAYSGDPLSRFYEKRIG